MTRLMKLLRQLGDRIFQYLIMSPWFLVGLFMRLLYGFRVEGAENIPREGPFILLLSEFGVICFLVSGWISIMLLKDRFFQSPDKVLSYMQEDLFALPYFRNAASKVKFMHALVPHSAGRLALSLMDGYKVLQKGGLVIMNPEGDMRWDGRPLPIGSAAAWLGLYTAAPVLPAIPEASAYDIWPRWQVGPSLRGRVVLRIGQPFKLRDTPMNKVTDDDLEKANARIRAEFDQLRYGPGGVSEWIGPPLRDGIPVPQTVRLLPASEAIVASQATGKTQVPVWKRGTPLLLWRCPVCRTNDALIHERQRFRPQTVGCQVCDTRWEMERVMGKDFRLKVVEGPPDLIGLDMPLSTWYDEMKRGFQPSPITVSDVELLPDEEVYLEVSGSSLSPYQPNALFDGWAGREPPQAQSPGQHELGDWTTIGEGRLLLTSHRLLWQGPQGELDFTWPSVTAVSIWMVNTLGIRYGTAPYRFSLSQETGLKWLTYAGTLALEAAERDGHTVTVTPF
jgi:1-acyl-sn-glycerol-3-phosphate acyltransferase